MLILAMLAMQPVITTCSVGGRIVTCTTPRRVDPLDYGAILQGGEAMVPDYKGPTPQEKAERFRRYVGGLVADGKCNEAESEAVAAGDFDLAGRVRAYCAKQ